MLGPAAQRALVRVGRWPRRIAALACVVLAAASAVLGHPAARSNTGVQLRPGEVAVPVQLARSTPALHAGDEVGVLAPPPDGVNGTAAGDAVLVADHLRVISTARASDLRDDTTATVVVATDRAAALRLARYVARPLVMIMDELP